ncbi:PaaI family thioesterase [Comamonas faecalis]|jgi:uncharacterized protein (TIGR00369 family)|uniref:Medium/long-chain acyl-CoA thioesterase YigI n=1 Tax=Comamonas faecalis TaxID=1387849 RepID=A0ABP7QZU4_9BURK|nr:PaaI family thioesterase [Pseudomonadota bacterium]HRO53647.1 PaaI family thioesterase [Alicycliphilus sp.]
MSRSIEDARRVLDAQPFSRLVRAEMTQYTTQVVELRVPITEQIQQQHGFVHGGVVSYLADNALTFAGGMALGPGVVTSEYKINYVRPAVGDWLVVRATAVHAGRTQAVCRCDVYVLAGGTEKLCAVAQGTIALMGAKKTD